jgi:YHS domain-containing protein
VDEETTKADARGNNYFCSEYCMDDFLTVPRITYFSIEIGLAR